MSAGANPREGDRPPQEVYSLFIPIEGELLLLPDVAVVESSGIDLVRVRADGPAWLLGVLPWQEREIPVVSFEGLCGLPVPARTRRTRVAIVNSPGRFLDTGLFALVIQGHPQLIALTEAAVQPAALRDTDAAQFLLARVNVGNRQAVIPDLEAIETLVADI